MSEPQSLCLCRLQVFKLCWDLEMSVCVASVSQLKASPNPNPSNKLEGVTVLPSTISCSFFQSKHVSLHFYHMHGLKSKSSRKLLIRWSVSAFLICNKSIKKGQLTLHLILQVLQNTHTISTSSHHK